MQKTMHFYKVLAIKQANEEKDNEKVDLKQMLSEIERISKIDRGFSGLIRTVKSRQLGLMIYDSNGDYFKGRFCVMKDGPLSEGVIGLDDGSERVGLVYAQGNTKLIFNTVAFVYSASLNLVGLSVNCNGMLQDFLNVFNNDQDFGVDTVEIIQDDVFYGSDAIVDTEFVNSIYVEFLTSDAKNITGSDFISKTIQSFPEFDKEATIGIKIKSEEVLGGETRLISKQQILEFWETNKDHIQMLEINPDRKGSFKFGKQKHTKKFDTNKEGDVLDAAELNNKAIAYLYRE